jgi:glycosyltransferase involved in cell wall biosynthesis
MSEGEGNAGVIDSHITLGMFYRAQCSLGPDGHTIWPVYGRLVDQLAHYFEKIIFAEPTATFPLDKSTYRISSDNVSIFELPYFNHADEFFRVAAGTWRKAKEAVRPLDLVYIRLPLPSAWLIWREAKRQGKKIVLHIVGDLRQQYNRKQSLISRMGAKIGVEFFENINQFMINRSLTITQGKHLERKHSRPGNLVYELSRVPLEKSDIIYRNDTCLDSEVKLLWVGNIHGRKGLDDLVRAVKICRDNKNFLSLYIIGDGDQEVKRNLREIIISLNLEEAVTFAGFVPYGPELFSFYDNSDIFVYPSFGEGFPRAIFEAMARGIPIVATGVGGIPEIVQHNLNGILINPGDPAEIAKAIKRIMSDVKLRKKLIAVGRSTVENYTLDSFCERFMALLDAHFNLNHAIEPRNPQ